MKTEENMHCNFCYDGMYEKKDEFMEQMLNGSMIKYQLHKCNICEQEMMRGIGEEN